MSRVTFGILTVIAGGGGRGGSGWWACRRVREQPVPQVLHGTSTALAGNTAAASRVR